MGAAGTRGQTDETRGQTDETRGQTDETPHAYYLVAVQHVSDHAHQCTDQFVRHLCIQHPALIWMGAYGRLAQYLRQTSEQLNMCVFPDDHHYTVSPSTVQLVDEVIVLDGPDTENFAADARNFPQGGVVVRCRQLTQEEYKTVPAGQLVEEMLKEN